MKIRAAERMLPLPDKICSNHPLPRRAMLAAFAVAPFLRPCCACAQADYTIHDDVMICGFDGPLEGPIVASEGDGALLKYIDMIVADLAIPSDLRVWNFNAARVASTFFQGERVILYDDAFSQLIASPNGRWTGLTLLAHEVGHLLVGHPLKKVTGNQDDGKLAEIELVADRFCGAAICRIGGSEANLTAAFESVSLEGANGYPSRRRRRAAARSGWHSTNSPTETLHLFPPTSPEPITRGWDGDTLRKRGLKWHEYLSGKEIHSYDEIGREDDFTEIYSSASNETILLPRKGGMSYIKSSTDDSFEDLTIVGGSE